MPPSFSYEHRGVTGSVLYTVSAVGSRAGIFQPNRRSTYDLEVVPADPNGSMIADGLRNGWQGEWTKRRTVDRIRKGFWGEYANVEMEVNDGLGVVFLLLTVPLIVPLSVDDYFPPTYRYTILGHHHDTEQDLHSR